MGISIARWLSSSMWDFLLFCLLHTIPVIIFYSTHSAISMAHAHVLLEGWKRFRLFKYEPIAWLKPGLFLMGVFCVMKMKHSLTIWFCRDELSFAMLFWEDMITLISMLEVLLFLLSIWTFILNHLDLNIHATIKKITLRNMLGSIPYQKFCFYHFPTRGRAGIKLGDAWYVSNVSIIFDCSMLLYYMFWMFYMH